MKKLFTLAAAVLASMAMMAQTTLATFEVTLTENPTTTYASYEDEDATYTCNKVGSSSSSNYYKASNDKYYLKLTGDDAYIQIKLKSGSFAADDTVFYALNHSQKKSGIGFTFNKSAATATTDMTAAGVEVIGKYTLTAADIEDDGSIKMLRASSNTFVNRIYVIRAGAITAPVAEVTIEGPARGTASYAAEFTASTDIKADAYQWFVNDAAQEGATAKTFEFTPADAGDYSIVCKARNANNATGEWIASEPIAFKALSSLCGELIKAVHTGKTTATVTGLIGGTADKSTESGGKINSDGYFGIQLASGNFQEGDTLVVNIGNVSSSDGAVLIVYAEKEAENVILNTEVAGVSGDNKFVLPAAVNGKNALYIVRTADNAWNAVVNSISVVRPMAVKSSSEAFKSVSFNDEALVANFDANHAMTVEGSYVDAPVVVFTKTVTTIYEDNSQVVKDVEVNVTAEEVAGAWQAQAEINSVTYTINAAKAASVVVTYMDGETVLGTENVAINETVAEYAQYQSKNLATFVGWYQDADLTIEANLEAPITAETYLYAKFENKYAESINIEQLVLDNGTTYDLMSFMGGKGFASNITNSLDTLNDLEKKDNRNYAYLGLKVKAEGKLLNFRLAANSTVKVKFGNVGATPLVSINGGEYAAMELTEGVYTYTATDEALISIKTASTATLIFKQIMIDADLAEVVLPAPGAYAITLTPGENGQLAASWEGKTDKKVNVPVGATVTLNVTPAEGYTATSVKLNGEDIIPVENVYSFVMPAQVAEIVATFGIATAIDNAEAAVKAEKVIRDGQVLILRDGKIFNALGAEVK